MADPKEIVTKEKLDDAEARWSTVPAWEKRRRGSNQSQDRAAATRPEINYAREHSPEFEEIKTRVHRELIDRLDLNTLTERQDDGAVDEVRGIVRTLISEETAPLNLEERELIVELVLNEVFGLGPLEPLLQDAEVSDILVNTCDNVFVERNGRISKTNVRFRDNDHLLQVIDRIVSAVGRRIDDQSPMVDARLSDGSRVNAIVPPLSIDGPHLSIRKFRNDALSAADLIRSGALTEDMHEFIEGCVKARLNVLISGGTGAGKTTLLNVMSEAIPANERIVTIEDSAELQLRQPHVVRLETRPPNVEGSGQVTQRQLTINALRMRPDRIILGEVRGAEAVDMMQAMNTGHDGSLTTLHANGPRDALSRLETLVSMAGLNIAEKAIREQIASAIDLVIHVARLSDGTRRVTTISEIVGMEGQVVSMQELFAFERDGIDEAGAVVGRFTATGIRPKYAERLREYGVQLGESLFSNLGGYRAADFETSGGGVR